MLKKISNIKIKKIPNVYAAIMYSWTHFSITHGVARVIFSTAVVVHLKVT